MTVLIWLLIGLGTLPVMILALWLYEKAECEDTSVIMMSVCGLLSVLLWPIAYWVWIIISVIMFAACFGDGEFVPDDDSFLTSGVFGMIREWFYK